MYIHMYRHDVLRDPACHDARLCMRRAIHIIIYIYMYRERDTYSIIHIYIDI